jgi:hypothetical protein
MISFQVTEKAQNLLDKLESKKLSEKVKRLYVVI